MKQYFSEDYKVTEDREELEVISGAGGGSCFPAGTMVRTAHGFKPIENCTETDIILGYDRFGILDHGRISKIYKHVGKEIQDDLYFIYSGELCLFPTGITGNHAVLAYAGEHKEIKDFVRGEYLVDLEGFPVEITKIVIQSHEEYADDFIVYNFTIEPQHTFLAGSSACFIRVHNGGGGKSGGGAVSAAQEAPNTLQSSSTARILDLISQGEIVGLVGGAKGVYFDNTPLQNLSGTYNFGGNFKFNERKGTVSQTVIPGFSQIETEVSLPGTTVTVAAPIITNLPDYTTGTNIVHSARVTIRLPDGLWFQNISNGDLNGHTVTYSIYVKDRLSATWSLALTKTLQGKATTAYEIAHKVYPPSGSTQWDIKVVRDSADETLASRKSTIVLSRITLITEESLSYNGKAYVGLEIPAKAVGNQIPARGYLTKGIKVQIPANYNPVTRTYTDMWDGGSFTTAWTDNTAWILYDIITNPTYGLSNYLGTAIAVDVWEFYNTSLWNDCASWNPTTGTYSYSLVSDGSGGYEARYTFNGVIATQSDAWQLLQAIASNMHCLVVMEGNLISLIQDRPRTSRKIFNNSNVLDGTFLYSSTEVTARNTQINVTFNDKNQLYLPRTISEQDNTAIAAWGLNVKDVVCVGVVTEGRARREARRALYTEIKQFDLVSFSAALNIVDISVGDVVTVMDNDFISDSNIYLAGRLVSVTGNVAVLDAPITLVAGHTYTLGIMSPDYSTIFEYTVTTLAGTTDTLALSASPPTMGTLGYVNREFMCYSSGYIEPRKFIIVNIQESDRGKYALSGIFYDPSKYSYIETGLVVTPTSYSSIISAYLPEVSNITFTEHYMNDDIASHNYIAVKWNWDESHTVPDIVTYRLKWRRDNRNYVTIDNITVKEYHIPDTTPGVYDVIIEAVNVAGKTSAQVLGTFNFRTASGTSSLVAPINFYVKGTTGTTFTGTHIPLTWEYNTANDSVPDALFDYVLESWTPDGVTKLKSWLIPYVPGTKGGNFDYTLADNKNDFGILTPSRSVQFRLYSRDTIGDLSTATTITCSNPVPAAPTFTMLSGVGITYVSITPPNEPDVKGYIIYRDTTNGFTPGVGNQVYDGADTYVSLGANEGTQYYFKVAAYDDFGKTGLNTGTQQGSSTLTLDAVNWSLSGISFDIQPSNIIHWVGGVIYKNGVSQGTVASGSSTWTTGSLYIYYNPDVSTTTLQHTTTLAVATGVNCYPLAMYTGGGPDNLHGGDGNAIINGSQVVAGTVGASQLVAGSAVITGTAQIQDAIISTTKIIDANITNAKIADATIDTAKIKDKLQSTNWDATAHTGWRLETGNSGGTPSLDMYAGAFNLYASDGTLIFSAANKYNGAYIKNATVDTLQVAGNAITIPVSAYTAGAISLVLSTDVTVQTATITSSGAPILISYSIALSGSESYNYDATLSMTWNRYVTVYLKRGATILQTISGVSGLVSFYYVDTPGAGSATYTVVVNLTDYRSAAGVGTASLRLLSLLEVKK